MTLNKDTLATKKSRPSDRKRIEPAKELSGEERWDQESKEFTSC